MKRTDEVDESRQKCEINENDRRHLATLEKVKREYQQYIEIAKLYQLPNRCEEDSINYEIPSPAQPLTTNKVQIN